LTALNEQAGKTKVKLTRSRRETRITISLFGSLEQSEERLQRIYKGILG